MNSDKPWLTPAQIYCWVKRDRLSFESVAGMASMEPGAVQATVSAYQNGLADTAAAYRRRKTTMAKAREARP